MRDLVYFTRTDIISLLSKLLEAEEYRSKRLTASESPPHGADEDVQLITFKATPLLGGGAHRRIGPLPPPPDPALNGHLSGTPDPFGVRRPTKSELEAIIARASGLAASSPIPSSIALPTPTSEGTPKSIVKSLKGRDWSKATHEEKEKRMKKLVGEVVVKTLSKWKREFSHDQFKKIAREVCTYLSSPVYLRAHDLSYS